MLGRSHQLTRFSPAPAGKGKLHCLAHILAQPVVMSSEAACHAVALANLEASSCITDGAAAGSLDFARDDSAAPPLHLEAFAQIKLTTNGIVDKKILSAFALDAPIVNQIGTVHDGQSLAHVVVGDHDGQP